MVFLLCIVIALAAFLAWRAASRKVQEKNQAFKGAAGLAALVGVVFVVLAVLQCFAIIPAGNVGVQDVFGVVSENTIRSGINPVNPFARIVKFSIQTTEHKEAMQVLSREGLTIGRSASCITSIPIPLPASTGRSGRTTPTSS